MNDNLKCSVCNGIKNTLTLSPSQIMPKMNLYLCNTCLAQGYEPRYLVVLAARSFGADYVKKFLDGNLYVGKPVTSKDLT